MSTDDFFDEVKQQSVVKAEIVRKYFWAWAKVMMPHARRRSGRISYVDLFAGPGRYHDEDGTESTPIHILKTALRDPEMPQMLQTWFNDKDLDHVNSLKQAIDEIPGISSMSCKPIVTNYEVGTSMSKGLRKMSEVPTLFFADPFGYKGLSLDLISSVLPNWGCDCIIFFNYNRVNMSLNNPVFTENMVDLFGRDRAERLRDELRNLPPAEREAGIIESISEALRERGGSYVLPFRFIRDTGKTSHHLLFVSKNVLGYKIMKDIMAAESSSAAQGAASFEYSPATINQPILFEYSRTIDDLADMLLGTFAGQTLTLEEVYRNHNIGRPFVEGNYRKVLTELEAQGKVQTSPSAAVRPKRKGQPTFAPHVKVAFPPAARD